LGILPKGIPAMTARHFRPLFHSCDAVLENISGGRILILANEAACAAIERAFPDVPFDWIREGVDQLPRPWRWICVIPSKVSKLNPPDIAVFSTALLRARCRVVIAKTESYKFLHSEADILGISA
jgi:hypothetical protein